MQSLEILPKFLLNIAHDIHELGGESHLVGGWVRDHILGVDSKDYDVEVSGLEEEVLLAILNRYGKASSVGKSFGVYLMRHLDVQYDFSFPRTEVKIGDGHRGFEIQSDPFLDFVTASQRRDFTINAMGFNLVTGQIVDPQKGQQDLDNRLLKHVGPAFGEDPLRALRAIQFASRFDLTVPQATVDICAEQDLSELSTERFEEEFKKLLLKSTHISKGLWLIREMKLLRFFPELESLIPTRDELSKSSAKSQNPEFELGLQLNTATLYLDYFDDERDQLVFMYTLLGLDLDDAVMDSFLARFTNDIKLIKRVQARRRAWFRYRNDVVQLSDSDDMSHDLSEISQMSQILPGVIRRIALDCPIQEFALILWIKSLKLDLKGRKEFDGLGQSRSIWKTTLLSNPQPTDLDQIQFTSDIIGLVHSAKNWGVFDEAPTAWYQGRDLISLGYTPGPQFGPALKACFEMQMDEAFEDKDTALLWLKNAMSK